MHAMEDNVSSQTIRLMGYIHNKHVSILLDTGSTHNFVDPKVVQRTGLNLTPEPSSESQWQVMTIYTVQGVANWFTLNVRVKTL